MVNDRVYGSKPLYDSMDADGRTWSLTLTASLLLHGLVTMAFIFSPQWRHKPDLMSSVITVSMVSLPPGPPGDLPKAASVAAESPPKQPEAKEAPLAEEETAMEEPVPAPEEPVKTFHEKIPEPVVQPKEKVVLPDIPEEKIGQAATVEKSIKQIKPKLQAQKPKDLSEQVMKPEDSRSESIKEALDQLRRKVGQQTVSAAAGKGASAAGKPGGTGVNGGGGGGGSIDDIYKAQLSYQIEKNWVFSQQMAGGHSNLRAVLVIRILPSGHIEQVWFEEKSGNTVLDDSAYRAVMKSNPLPPLPKGYPEYTVALVFTPAGLN